MNRKFFLKSLFLIPFAGTAMTFKNLTKISESFPITDQMPLLFIGHGSPMNAIEDNKFSKKWNELGKTIPKPNAILCISAHWETKGTFLTAMPNPKTIHDFGGFPQALFDVQYPAKGSPELAELTRNIIKNTQAGLDEKWGLDHGCWSILKHIYPKADVPVIQMSLDFTKDPLYHYELGKELTALRNKGVLIIGSGNMVHNLGLIAWDKMKTPEYGYDWAIEANEKMKQFILNNNHASLINYKSQGKAFDLAIPSPDHYLPLLYILALKEESEKVNLFNDKALLGSLTMTSLIIE